MSGIAEVSMLTTKFNRPQVDSGWILRPRLISALNEARNKRLTLISAPAGYGKTTFLAQWFDQIPGSSAWLSLDKYESDPDRFLRYLIAAIRRSVPGFGPEIESLLTSPTLPPPDYLADTLISDLSVLKKALILVLDDFHTIASEPVEMMVSRLVQYLPDNLHLVISTRVDPPLPLASWRTRNWMAEFRAADLRFFKDEAQAYFAQSSAKTLSTETVDIFLDRTEGWIAGLQVARLSLADAENPEQVARKFSGSYREIVDFLTDEVISAQPSEIRDFLALTAMFERFCAPLCDFIRTGESVRKDSSRLIAQLERKNLFLVPLDKDRDWYRYHHLFRSILTQQVRENIAPERKVLVHRRAGEWFASQGLIEETLRHFLAAGDVDRAADLVELNLNEVVEKDLSRRTLGRWLDVFPKSAEKQHPALLVARLYCRTIHWDLEGMALLTDEAEKLLRNPACNISKSRRQNLLSEIDALRANYLYWSGDIEGSLRHALRALNNTPKKYRHFRFSAVMYAGAAYAMNGLRDEGLHLLDDAISKALSSGSRYAGAYLTIRMGIFHYAGNLAAVKQTGEQILALHETDAVHLYWVLHAHYFLGAAAYESNHLDTARVHFQSVERMRYRVNTRPYHDSLIGLALVALAKGETAAARECAVSARSFAVEVHDAYSLKISDSFQTRLALVSGGIPAESLPLRPTVDFTQMWLENPSLTFAEYMLSKANPEECSAGLLYVEKALKQVRKHHNTLQVIQLLAVKAVALKCVGRMDKALEVLEEALSMAEPLGFVRTFVDRGPLMGELLNVLLERHPENLYIRRLLDAFRGETPSGEPVATTSVTPLAQAGQPADPFLASGLSNRELTVLRMLEEGLTNKEIANRLFVATDTVRKHTVNLYRKLNVHSRLQALAAARRRGLLAPR